MNAVLRYIMALICVSSQSFENPAINSTILCGLTESCAIICESANSCEGAEFYLYSNDAYIECSGPSSCKSLQIISLNATSFALHVSGYNAFSYGVAWVQQPNQHVIVRCVHDLTCQSSSFYYNGIGQTADHYCAHNGSCASALISAIPIHTIHLICDAAFACDSMDVYTPIHRYNTSIIHINAIATSTHIYSMHGLYNLNITCNESCAETNQIYIIYGKEYQSYCAIHDVSCMQSTEIQSVAFNEGDIAIVYNDDRMDLSDTETVLFMLYTPNNTVTPNGITSQGISSYIHVVCVDQIHYPSCDNIHFNFSLSNDAVLTANNARSMTIIGPSHDFKRVAYRDNSHANLYYLYTTSSISLQCNQLQGGQCLHNSSLYTESPANLQILCGADDCHYSDIYTTIDPTLSTSTINIVCYPSNTSCNAPFLLHFANNVTCNTPNDPKCIAFLSSSPTFNPTFTPSTVPSLSPSMYPSLNPSLSPVPHPTSMPSNSPTFAPSHSPTIPPTNNPTWNPSNSPTMSPTDHPSFSPSIYPTLAPSMYPTVAPSHSPTVPPSNYPTVFPSSHPTLAPSHSPTLYPTFSPTIAPSSAPTSPPTIAPTMPPTRHPTHAPTTPPTHAPTHYPTLSPTHAPTRHPTQDIYTQTIYIDYIIHNITHNISAQLYDPTVQKDLEELFENCYLLTSQALIHDQNQTLHYRDFHLLIVDVFTYPYTPSMKEAHLMESIPLANHTAALLKANIRYADESVGDTIRFISRRLYFQNLTEVKLQRYFNRDVLQLIVGDPWEEGDGNDIHNAIIIDSFFIFVMSIGFLCMVLGIASFIYNNWEGTTWTDNGNSMAIPLYGLQMVDIFTDINLCVEMFSHFSENAEDRVTAERGSPILLWIAAWGALSFTVIPYTTNICLAANITSVKEIRHNPFAKSYFQTTSWFFIVLVVFCGAVYPALSVVSSRLFAFEFLNSGLTMKELAQLTRWRLHLTILLENVPQLFCSLFYILYLGVASHNTVLAMIVSALQIVATVTNYIVTYRPSDCRAIEYDLQMEIDETKLSQSWRPRMKSKESITAFIPQTSSATLMDMNDIEEEDSDDDEEDEGGDTTLAIDIFDDGMEIDPTPSTLTADQKTQIRRRKERKSSLRRSICTELSLRLNAIEIGYITLTPNGCIIHMIHYTFESEAKAFRDAKKLKRVRITKSVDSYDFDLEHIAEQAMLMSPLSVASSLGSPRKSDGYHVRWEGDRRSFERTAKSFFKDLYKRKSDEIECALSSHFGFKQELISVTYHKRYPYTSWEMVHRDRFSTRDLRNTGSAKYHPIAQLTKADSIEIASMPMSAAESSKRSATDELQQSTNTLLQTLMTKIREKLMENDKDTVKAELLEEGYNETLIDRVFEMGELLAAMTGMSGMTPPESKDNGDAEDEETVEADKENTCDEEQKSDNANGNDNKDEIHQILKEDMEIKQKNGISEQIDEQKAVDTPIQNEGTSEDKEHVDKAAQIDEPIQNEGTSEHKQNIEIAMHIKQRSVDIDTRHTSDHDTVIDNEQHAKSI
eukprot:53445_1